MNILAAIGYIINTYKEKTEEIAKKVGFKKRKGKIEALTFTLAITLCIGDLKEITLKTILRKCENIQDGLKISKQGLFKRMEAGARLMEELYKNIFNESSKNEFKSDYLSKLNQFDDVFLTDASTVSLPEKLEELYEGLGGKNANSALKIQTTYSILQQKITDLDLYSATKNDATYNKVTLSNIKENALYIKDLGYYSGKYFDEVEQNGAYYLSRIKSNTKLFEYNEKEDTYKEIDYCKMYRCNDSFIDENCFIRLTGSKMLKVRLVCVKLPEDVISERLRKANKNAKKKKKALSKKEKLMLRWNVFITNVEEEKLDVETICKLYRIRWQLELLFKAMKTGLSFDNFGYAGINYFKCLLYGKLINLLMVTDLFAWSRNKLYVEFGRLVSIQSFFKNIRPEMNKFIAIFKCGTDSIIIELENIIMRIGKLSFFDKRKRKTSEEELMVDSSMLPEKSEFKLVS